MTINCNSRFWHAMAWSIKNPELLVCSIFTFEPNNRPNWLIGLQFESQTFNSYVLPLFFMQFESRCFQIFPRNFPDFPMIFSKSSHETEVVSRITALIGSFLVIFLSRIMGKRTQAVCNFKADLIANTIFSHEISQIFSLKDTDFITKIWFFSYKPVLLPNV